MQNWLESLGELLGSNSRRREVRRRHSRRYQCRCDKQVFFRNSLCLGCQAPLGYLCDDAALVPLSPGTAPGTWQTRGHDGEFGFCANREMAAGCNWLKAADDPNPLCVACRLNRTIPDQRDPENARLWALIEPSKRRLVAELLALQLPVKSKVDEDPANGLMFDFLRTPPEGPRVLTGHADGLITLNIEEADDARRERIRLDLHEPYRTLLGHFRHEVGHYYWDRLVRDGPWLEPYRRLFGDERADYGAALRANYLNGPPADWADRHISSYASTHSWEDWAETWAHYLHIVDTLETATAFGLRVQPGAGRDAALAMKADFDPYREGDFGALVRAWLPLTYALNSLNQSMGQAAFYPFVLVPPVMEKMRFIHDVIRRSSADAGESAQPANPR